MIGARHKISREPIRESRFIGGSVQECFVEPGPPGNLACCWLALSQTLSKGFMSLMLQPLPGTDRLRNESGARPRFLITTQRELLWVVDTLSQVHRLGLDVETELYSPRLCLMQLATETETFLIDPFAMNDLSVLRSVFETAEITKVIHNSSFERRVLGHVGFGLDGVYDTLTASRRLHGHQQEGGHSLAVVCQRELGVTMSKALQCSNWAHRPLSASQLDYAALDAEVLLPLHDRFRAAVTGQSRSVG